MDITITTYADTATATNVEQEHRLIADRRTHVAVHLGKGVYLHLLVDADGSYLLKRGDYATEWLSDVVSEGNAYGELADNLTARTVERRSYEDMYMRVFGVDSPLPVGDILADAVLAYGTLHKVIAPGEWEGGMRGTVEGRRRQEYLEGHSTAS